MIANGCATHPHDRARCGAPEGQTAAGYALSTLQASWVDPNVRRMKRQPISALFAVLLLIGQVAQGVMAAALPCEADFVGYYTPCVAAEVFDGDHESHASQGSQSNELPQHCRLCASGACTIAHAPALGGTPGVAMRLPLASVPPSEPRIRISTVRHSPSAELSGRCVTRDAGQRTTRPDGITCSGEHS